MPLFYYRALSDSGETLEGEMEAANKEAVIASLQDSGQMPIHTEQVLAAGAKKQKSSLFGGRHQLSQQEVTLLTNKLAIMLKAGLPLDGALTMMADLTDEGPGRKMLERIHADVQNGAPLSEAMQAYPNVFNKLYINTLKAGEAAGALESVLAKLSDYLQRSQELKETIKSALIYPTILLVVALASLAILMIYVVPQFSTLFEGMDKALPVPTQIVISISTFLQKFWWVILVAIVLIVQGVKWLMNHPPSRHIIDARLLQLPLVSGLITRIEVARFSRTLETLLSNGVPLLNGLEIVREILTNNVIADAIDSVSERLREGHGMARPLADTGCFPQLAVQLIHVGEETGELEKMLGQLADIYDNEVKESVKRMLTLLEPAMIVGLGILIAGIILSILLAIISLNDFAI